MDELFADAHGERAALHCGKPAAGDLLDVRKSAAEVRQVGLDERPAGGNDSVKPCKTGSGC